MLRYGRLSQTATGVIWALRCRALARATINTVPPAGRGLSLAAVPLVRALLPMAADSAIPMLRKAHRRHLCSRMEQLPRRFPVLPREPPTRSLSVPQNEAPIIIPVANRGALRLMAR